MKPKNTCAQSYSAFFLWALALHILVLVFLAFQLTVIQPNPSNNPSAQSAQAIIQAVAVSQSTLEKPIQIQQSLQTPPDIRSEIKPDTTISSPRENRENRENFSKNLKNLLVKVKSQPQKLEPEKLLPEKPTLEKNLVLEKSIQKSIQAKKQAQKLMLEKKIKQEKQEKQEKIKQQAQMMKKTLQKSLKADLQKQLLTEDQTEAQHESKNTNKNKNINKNKNESEKNSENSENQDVQKNQGEIDKYKSLIIRMISQQWRVPENLPQNISCELSIKLAPGGVVLNVTLLKSSGNTVLDNSAIIAVKKSSPLPAPTDINLFNQFRELHLTVKPDGSITEQ